LANRAESLRKFHADALSIPKKAVKPIPPAPSIEDVRARKAEVLGKKADYFGGMSYFDVIALSEAVKGLVMFDPGAFALGVGGIATKRGLGMVLDRPSVVKWLSEPSPKDLQLLNKLSPVNKV